MNRRLLRSVMILAMAAVLAAGCATGRAFARAEEAGRAGDWEAAVGFYRQALDDDPDRPDYKIALERAMVAAAAMYAERARQFEETGQLEEALRAYRKAQEFEPSNRQLSAKAAQIERMGDLYVAREPLDELVKGLRTEAERGQVPARLDVGWFKERYALTRRTAIPLLEWLDRARVTRRDGDARVLLVGK